MPQSEFWPLIKNNIMEETSDGKSVLLEKQLGDMEGEMKEMQMELATIRRTRHDMKLSPFGAVVDSILDDSKEFETHLDHEGENKFQNEVSRLREDLASARKAAEDERFRRMKYETKLHDLEQKLNEICGEGKLIDISKEMRKNNVDEVANLKSQIRDLKEQLEEMKISDEEKTEQLQEYRLKYLAAQQNVEELQRQLDVMELDNKQASDQIELELHKMKMQFHEKLLELAPLPDLLKGAQIQLQEAKQLQKLAENNAQHVASELLHVKEKLVAAMTNLNQEKQEKSKLVEEINSCRLELDDKDKEIDELMKCIEEYKCKVLRLEEKHHLLEERYEERTAEVTLLTKNLQEVKDESTRSLTRVKERAEGTKHHLQCQVAELERQMISCRAQCRSYQKERDEVRQRTLLQINTLKENFEMAEVRLKALQRQIVTLKQCYSAVSPDEEENNEIDFANYTTHLQ